MTETSQQQIDKLANFIMAEIPGEPSASEGAVDTAIRWMRDQVSAVDRALNELGVPVPGYPQPVANAVAILTEGRNHSE